MIDLHCHILFDVDDGAPDVETSLEMAQCLHRAGFTQVAASPHFGEGPGGDVSRELAAERRAALQGHLDEAGIDLRLLPNAEHHVTPELFTRLQVGQGIPIGGVGHWLLIELPWSGIPNPETVLFRLQLLGYRLLLAHPERYTWLQADICERLAERGIKLQLELGSFSGVYGKRAQEIAIHLMQAGAAHVLASDLHRPKQAENILDAGMTFVRKRWGQQALSRGTLDNPAAMVADQSAEAIDAMIGSL